MEHMPEENKTPQPLKEISARAKWLVKDLAYRFRVISIVLDIVAIAFIILAIRCSDSRLLIVPIILVSCDIFCTIVHKKMVQQIEFVVGPSDEEGGTN